MWNNLMCVTRFNVNLLERMLADIPATEMCRQTTGLPNHPTWLVGHLAFVRFMMIKQTGGDTSDFPESWMALFGRNSTPSGALEEYPPKGELWNAFTRLHEAAMNRVTSLTPEQLAAPHAIVSLKEPFPTLGDLLLQMLTAHDGLHIGQLSDWRRTLGYPRLM
jgi:hypothetical protein